MNKSERPKEEEWEEKEKAETHTMHDPSPNRTGACGSLAGLSITNSRCRPLLRVFFSLFQNIISSTEFYEESTRKIISAVNTRETNCLSAIERAACC
jgi:hypothetical protein